MHGLLGSPLGTYPGVHLTPRFRIGKPRLIDVILLPSHENVNKLLFRTLDFSGKRVYHPERNDGLSGYHSSCRDLIKEI